MGDMRFGLNLTDASLYEKPFRAEGLSRYCLGGYHPVLINDRLKENRYEILDKLGFGYTSTVWLAKDHEANERQVAIKILIARDSTEDNMELKILTHIQQHGHPAHPGRRFVLQLLDSFFLSGPNGKHLCLVTDAFGPSLFEVENLSCRTNVKVSDPQSLLRYSHQMFEALKYIHSCGVVHGDFNRDNILVRYCNSRSSTVSQEPVIGTVSKIGGGPRETNIPAYLVHPIYYESGDFENVDEIRIIDFGESFFISSPPMELRIPITRQPPEILFNLPVTKAIDAWGLGVTTYEILTDSTLFKESGIEAKLVAIRDMLGGIPHQWVWNAVPWTIEDGEGMGIDLSKQDGPGLFELFVSRRCGRRSDGSAARIVGLSDEHCISLTDYLCELLEVDPEQRASLESLNDDPWIQFVIEVALLHG